VAVDHRNIIIDDEPTICSLYQISPNTFNIGGRLTIFEYIFVERFVVVIVCVGGGTGRR